MGNFHKRIQRKEMGWMAAILIMLLFTTYIVSIDNYQTQFQRNWRHDNLTFEATRNRYGSQDRVQYAIVACKVDDKALNHHVRENWNHQLRQIKVLLKSAAVLTSTTIHFNVITNSQEVYEEIKVIPEDWPLEYRHRLVFSSRKEVYYPKGLQHLQNMFARCATERLFLPFILRDLDAVIFVDTDTIFMQPPEDLWHHFHNFADRQVAGVTPCLYMYNEPFKRVIPSFGFSGLNAGVLLFNLTRIRHFPGGWVRSIAKILINYQGRLELADQDILNILFSGKNTPLAYEVGCEWNYRLKVCSLDRNRCPNAATRGVALLHGCATTFVNNEGPKIKAVFEAWENYDLQSPTKELIYLLEEGLQKVTPSTGGCTRLSNIDDILLKGIRRHLVAR